MCAHISGGPDTPATKVIVDSDVTLCVAGPGFGKSFWLHQANAAWQQDDTAISIAAVCCKGQSVAESLQFALQKECLTNSDVLSAWLKQPVHLRQPEDRALGIFIDDLQCCEDPEKYTYLTQLIDFLGPQDRIFICSAVMADIPLMRWQGHRRVLCLQEPELVAASAGEWPLFQAMKQHNWNPAALRSQTFSYFKNVLIADSCDIDSGDLARLSCFTELSDSLWNSVRVGNKSLFDMWQKYRFIYPQEGHPDRYQWIPQAQEYWHSLLRLKRSEKAGLLSAAGNYWLRHGHFNLLINTLSDDQEPVLTEENIIVPLVIAMIFTRRFHQAEYVIEQAEASAEGQQLAAVLQVLKDTLSLFLNSQQDGAEHVDIREPSDSKNEVIHCLERLLQAYRIFSSGDLDEAARLSQDTYQYMVQREQHYLAGLTKMLVIACDKYRGYMVQAGQQLAAEFRRCTDDASDPVWQNFSAGMVILYYEQNNLDKARELCERAMPHINSACSTEVITHFYLYYSRILHLSGDTHKSQSYLNQLQRLLSLGNYPRYTSKMVAEKMRQAYVEDDRKRADYLADKYSLDESHRLQTSASLDCHDWRSQGWGYYLSMQQQYSQAVGQLENLRCRLLDAGHLFRASVTEAQISGITWLSGDQRTAADMLRKSIDFYGWLHFNRSLFDEAPGVLLVLRNLIENAEVKPPAIFLKMFSTLIFPEDKTEDAEAEKRFSSLTGKEKLVVKLLATGRSNQEIAEESGISESTVKWHLKNIYRKLGMESRSAVVAYIHSVRSLTRQLMEKSPG